MFKRKVHNDKPIEEISLENNQTIELTNVQIEIFEKYANMYGLDKNSKKNIEREKYIYNLASSKGIENTAIEKLLDLVIKDIELQYSTKQSLEYKAGFMIALWGMLLAAVLQDELIKMLYDNIIGDSLKFYSKIEMIIILMGLTVSGICSLVCIVKTLLVNPYCRYEFDKRDKNFRCAVEDKNMLLVKLLDSNTTVWEKNESANEKKYKSLRALIICILIFVMFAIRAYILR